MGVASGNSGHGSSFVLTSSAPRDLLPHLSPFCSSDSGGSKWKWRRRRCCQTGSRDGGSSGRETHNKWRLVSQSLAPSAIHLPLRARLCILAATAVVVGLPPLPLRLPATDTFHGLSPPPSSLARHCPPCPPGQSLGALCRAHLPAASSPTPKRKRDSGGDGGWQRQEVATWWEAVDLKRGVEMHDEGKEALISSSLALTSAWFGEEEEEREGGRGQRKGDE